MDKHPNQYLNEFVANFVIRYLRVIGYAVTGSPINMASWKFLGRSQISAVTNNIWELGDLAHQAALLQRQLVCEGHQNTSLRSIVRSFPKLLPLVAHGPQAWLINTYRQPLENILELDRGTKKYGQNQAVYRNIKENVMAARMMFTKASQLLADKIFEENQRTANLGIFEGGAGNGAATLTILKKFHDNGIFPGFLLSDIDEATREVALKLFQSRGFQSSYFPWTKLDIGNPKDMATVAKYFEWNNLIVNVNFIIHEWEPIANKFFFAMNKSLPKAKLAISEFFLPEDETRVGPDFPWWFVYLHDLSSQHLRTEKQFLAIAKKHGYSFYDRLNHQIYKPTNKPIVTTLFLAK